MSRNSPFMRNGKVRYCPPPRMPSTGSSSVKVPMTILRCRVNAARRASAPKGPDRRAYARVLREHVPATLRDRVGLRRIGVAGVLKGEVIVPLREERPEPVMRVLLDGAGAEVDEGALHVTRVRGATGNAPVGHGQLMHVAAGRAGEQGVLAPRGLHHGQAIGVDVR